MSTRTRTSLLGRPGAGSTVLVHVLLVVFVVIAIGPILLILMNSLKTQLGIFSDPFAFPTAETFSVEGYVRALSLGNFGGFYANSITVTVVSTVLTVVLSSLAAFAIVEYKVRLAPILGAIFIVGIMLPVRLGTVSILELMVSWR